MNFQSNKIFLANETVAEQLRSTRQAKKIKLSEVAKKLNINKKYLESLERGNFENLPTGIYGKKFLKEYAIFLGLDHNEIIKIFQKEVNINEKSSQKELFSRQVAKVRFFLTTPKIIKNIILTAIVIACFFYLGSAVKKIISPPFLVLENPYENLVTDKKNITITGSTEAESQILINGKHVLIDSSGNFTEDINLKTGINIITVKSRKKYGRENTIIRQILVKD